MVTRSLSSDVDRMTSYNLNSNRSQTFTPSSGIGPTSRFSEGAQNVTSCHQQQIGIRQRYTFGEDFDVITYGFPYLKRIYVSITIKSVSVPTTQTGFLSVFAKVRTAMRTVSQLAWLARKTFSLHSNRMSADMDRVAGRSCSTVFSGTIHNN